MGLGCDCPGSPQVGTAESCVPYAVVQSFCHRRAGLITAHCCLLPFAFNFHIPLKDHSPHEGLVHDAQLTVCVGETLVWVLVLLSEVMAS